MILGDVATCLEGENWTLREYVGGLVDDEAEEFACTHLQRVVIGVSRSYGA